MSKKSRSVITASGMSRYSSASEPSVALSAFIDKNGQINVEVPGEPMMVLPPESTPWTAFRKMEADAKRPDDMPECECWINSRYQVLKTEGVPLMSGDVEMTWLSIKRLDRESCHDWRDFQRIKNELCGPEREALELYPAESRLVDTSNQYHLWVFPAGVGAPLGFTDRLIADDSGQGELGAKQRSFDPGATPEDAISHRQVEERIARGDD